MSDPALYDPTHDWLTALVAAKPIVGADTVRVLAREIRLRIGPQNLVAHVSFQDDSVELCASFPTYNEPERLEILLSVIYSAVALAGISRRALGVSVSLSHLPSERWRVLNMQQPWAETLAVGLSKERWAACGICRGPVCTDLLGQTPTLVPCHPECHTYAHTVLLPALRAARAEAAAVAAAQKPTLESEARD